jgi:hypothetical protein
MRIEGSTVACPCTGRHLLKEMRNFSIVIVFRYAADLMVVFEHREEAEPLQGIN